MAVRTVTVKLTADVGGYTTGIDKAARANEKLTDSSEKTRTRGKAAWDSVGAGAAAASAVGVAAVGAMVSSFMDFDAAMSGVAASSGATGAELNKLRQAALQAGADTAFSATEAAQAQTELAKAGVATADILGGGLKGALDLAAAGQIGVGEAAEAAASAMTQFGLSGEKVPHIADLLAAAAGKAQGGVGDMNQALNQAGLVAAQAGLSIEETTGTLAAFASAGLLGSDAGTSLKTALLRLTAPTAEAKGLMDDLGISAYAVDGSFVGMESIAGQLQSRLGRLSEEQRNSAMATIFGSDAIRAASILYTEGASGVDEWVGKVDDAGFAARQASQLTDNLKGDLERLRGSIDTALIQGGAGANTALRGIAQGAEAAVGAFAGLPSAVQMTGLALVTLGTAGTAAMAGFGMLVPRVQAGREALQGIGTAGQMADRALGAVGRTAGLAVGAFAVYEVASVSLAALQRAAIGAAPELANVQKALIGINSAADLGNALPNLGRDAEYLGAQMQRLADPSLGDRVRKGITGMAGEPAKLRDAKQNISAIDRALADMVASGNADAAAKSFQYISRTAQSQGASLDQVKAALPQYANAVTQAGNAAELAAGKTAKAGRAAVAAAPPMSELQRVAMRLGAEFKEGATAGDVLKSAIDRLNGAALNAAESEIGFRNATAAATAALRTNGRTIDLNTQKGRDNRSAVIAARRAAEDHAKAVTDQAAKTMSATAAVNVGNRAFAANVGQLRRVLTQSGLTKKQINELISTYARVPKSVETKVTARVSVVDAISANVAPDNSITRRNTTGSGTGRATGGWVPGHSPGDYSDNIPATIAGQRPLWLTGEEFVINRPRARAIRRKAPGLLEAINSGAVDIGGDTGAMRVSYGRPLGLAMGGWAEPQGPARLWSAGAKRWLSEPVFRDYARFTADRDKARAQAKAAALREKEAAAALREFRRDSARDFAQDNKTWVTGTDGWRARQLLAYVRRTGGRGVGRDFSFPGDPSAYDAGRDRLADAFYSSHRGFDIRGRGGMGVLEKWLRRVETTGMRQAQFVNRAVAVRRNQDRSWVTGPDGWRARQALAQMNRGGLIEEDLSFDRQPRGYEAGRGKLALAFWRAHPGLRFTDRRAEGLLQAWLRRVVAESVRTTQNRGALRFAAGGSIPAVQQWIRAQDPKPYIWGGAGPAGFDCSGLAGAVYGKLTGKGGGSGQRYFTTDTIGASQGFRTGRGAFTIGVTPGRGHMAAQLGGLKFEARSTAAGIIVGPGAASPASFARQFFLPSLGGAFGVDALSNRQKAQIFNMIRPQIAAQMMNRLQARAAGGPVQAGQLYRVNERGGEGYFVPPATGSIVPASGMTARNVTPAGTGDRMVASLAAELGRLREALAANRGPMLNIENNVMHDPVSVDLLTHRLTALENGAVGVFG